MADVTARFWSKVDRIGPDDCWSWQGEVKPNGYGRFVAAYRTDGRRLITVYAHRFAYLVAYGPVPPGVDADHDCHNRDASCEGGRTCRHRRCCNPAHLKASTRTENLNAGRYRNGQRDRLCRWGHPYGDRRYCRACNRLRHRWSAHGEGATWEAWMLIHAADR